MSLRSRLLLLVLSVLIPAGGAALWLIARTYADEQAALERNLADTTRAMAMVIDKALDQRIVIAQFLAQSVLLDAAPDIADEDLSRFGRMAKGATAGLAGWVELRSTSATLLDTRLPADHLHARATTGLRHTLLTSPTVVPLAPQASGTGLVAQVVQPVLRDGRAALNLILTVLPQELQAVIDAQRLPPDWIATVIDNRGTVVARHPDGPAFMGRASTADLKAHLAERKESHFRSVSLDGRSVAGFFSSSPQGWVYVIAMPRPLPGSVTGAVLQAALGALVLLALAVLGTLWHARVVAGAIKNLAADVARMQRGDIVVARFTGITECDQVARALASASQAIRQSEERLEGQVARAVALTRQAEQRFSHSQRVEALGRLTGGVAHDFNNLLGVVSNSAHVTQRLSTDPRLDAPLAAILRAVDTGTRLIQRLLRFAGQQPLHPQTVRLQTYLHEVTDLMKAVLGKSISVSVDVAVDTRPVQVDVSELELALINLSLNAHDAMPGGGTLSLRARNAEAPELGGLTPGDYVLIAMTDDGKGLDDEHAGRVFEPFFTTKPVGKGTGLGLSQVHGFCVQAGGTARFDSTRGIGTSVTLVLPARSVAPSRPLDGTVADSPVQPQRRMQPARVLLVDDNEELAEVTATLLATEGFSVQHAGNAEQALGMLEADPGFDVVLSDIVMPGPMDGIALAETLRQREPALPVVLISGYSDRVATVRGFTLLHKPCTPDLLSRSLRQAMRNGGRQTEP